MSVRTVKGDAAESGRRARGRRGAAGVLLLILLLGVAIVVFVMMMPGGAAETAVETQDYAEEQLATNINGAAVVQDIAAFEIQNNRLPSDVEELSSHHGREYLDPWDVPLRIEYVDGPRGEPASVVVRSAGPDGYWETGDDIASEHRLML